jgi:lipopolysaccharide export system permease protein
MNELARYVSRSVLGAMLLILFLLVGLDIVFSFIGELQGLRGGYRAPQAFLFAVLCEPGDAYQLLPIAALVGGIVGLGMLASSSELTVMRAAGVSIGRIVWWVLKPALLLVVLGVLLAQYIVPVAQQQAELGKAIAQGQSYTAAAQVNGYWHREGNRFVQIDVVRPDGVLQGINRFELDASGHLAALSLADSATYQGSGQGDGQGGQGWQLQGVQETRLLPDGRAQPGRQATVAWSSELTPDFLRLATVDPGFLSLTHLYSFAHHLSRQGLDAGPYFLEFWKKLLAPLATISMVLIACSFIFGPLRSVTMGLRILAGVMAGLLFRYGQDFFGYASLVYHFSPIVAAALPIAICLVIGGVAIARTR